MEDGMIMWHMVNAMTTTNYSFFSLSPWLPWVIGGFLDLGVFTLCQPHDILSPSVDIGAADFLGSNVIELAFQT